MTKPVAAGATKPIQPGNSYDAIRMLAATSVLISHQFALTGQPEPTLGSTHSLGGVALLVFFSLSGYLVTLSWQADPHVWRFLVRRALRIWPALALLCVLTVFVLGPASTALPLDNYFGSKITWQYFHALRMKIVYVLPGVFETNPRPSIVNGSLWTIPIEVRCYLAVALLGLVGLLRWRWLVPVLTALGILWLISSAPPETMEKRSYARELFIFFLCGSALCFLQRFWQVRPWLWLAACLTAALAALLLGRTYLALLYILPYLVIWGGSLPIPVLRDAGRWGDPSYGIYLYAFPIQQWLIAEHFPLFGFAGSLALALALTIGIAYLSWHLLEKHALRLKPHRRSMATHLSPTPPLPTNVSSSVAP
jgi:peptidoglycan/LPS O-acetylase OafA/YrhL